MSGKGPNMPASTFRFPPLSSPPSGHTVEEMDIDELFRSNANSTNEQGGKIQSLLRFLETFSENTIFDLDGLRHTILSRRIGAKTPEYEGVSCLRPKFLVDSSNEVHCYFSASYILTPHGTNKGLIPIDPTFQTVAISTMKPEDGLLLSDGDWEAWVVIEGLTARLVVQSATEPIPDTVMGSSTAWNIATWNVENTGDDDVTIDGTYYSCPFLPTSNSKVHPFSPQLYKKNRVASEGTEWFMKVNYGNVSDPLEGEVIQASGADNIVEHAATDGDIWWLKLTTNPEGKPILAELTSSEPTVIPSQQEESPVASGQNGVYKFKLFTLSLVNEEMVAEIHQGSDIVWHRWNHDNVGSGAKVYKMFNPDSKKHEFRTLISAGDVEVYEEGDTIVISYHSTPPE